MFSGDTDVLEREYERFLAFVEESGEDHAGKTVAIKGEEILGVFDSYLEAAEKIYVEHEPGTVLIQEVKRSVDALTARIATPFSI